MKRFRFPLRPVSVLRAHRELLAREAFGSALQAFAQTQEALGSSRRRVAEFEAEVARGRQGTFAARDQAGALAAYGQVRAAEQEAERAMCAARDVVEQRRQDYLRAHQQLEVVRRLEDKARGRHRAEVAREEQAQFDERATRMAARSHLFKS